MKCTVEEIEALLLKTFNVNSPLGMEEKCHNAAVDIFHNFVKPLTTVQPGAKIEDEWAVKSRELGVHMNKSLTEKWGKK